MQSATGQYGTHAGDPAQPVQHSVMIASSLGRFLRGVVIPWLLGSILITAVSMQLDYNKRNLGGSGRGRSAPVANRRTGYHPAPQTHTCMCVSHCHTLKSSL